MSLILKEEYENLVVVDLDNGISFVHDNKTGKNYFNDEMIAKCTGLSISTVRDHWGNFKLLGTNVHNMNVSLKLVNVDKPVSFKSFDFLTYVAYRSNKEEAIAMRNYISDAIDEKFNRDVGFSPMVDRLANAMHLDKVEQAERINQLEAQVLSLAKRVGENRELKREINILKKEHMRDKIEIADLYGKLSTITGKYYKRQLEELEKNVNCNLDEWL